MGSNVNLNAAQKAMVQRAIDEYNKTAADNKKIDADDVFTIAKNQKDGVITIKVDAYGFNKDEEGNNALTTVGDQLYDLELVIKDDTYNTKDADSLYRFTTLDDSSDNIQEMVKKHQALAAKMDQKYVEFNVGNDARLKNMDIINERFDDEDTPVININKGTEEAPISKPQVTEDDLDAGIANLKAKLEMVEDAEITSSTGFLTKDEKERLLVSENVKKDTKAIRKAIVNQIKKAIEDLEAMKEALDNDKAQAERDFGKLNSSMQKLGISPKQRLALHKGASASEAFSAENSDVKLNGKPVDAYDYAKADVKDGTELDDDLVGAYAMLEPEEINIKYVQFGPVAGSEEAKYYSLPGHLTTPIVKKMTLVTVENAIKEYNKGKSEDQQIDLFDVQEGQITIDENTGDILIGLAYEHSVISDKNWDKHDGHYDYRIPGFYNKKSGVINTTDKLQLEPYGFASTKGVIALKKQLASQYEVLANYSGKDKKAQQKQIDDTIAKLKLAHVSDADLNAIKEGTYEFDD